MHRVELGNDMLKRDVMFRRILPMSARRKVWVVNVTLNGNYKNVASEDINVYKSNRAGVNDEQ